MKISDFAEKWKMNQNVFKGVLMFVPEENLFVYAFFGNGDNLFEEDEELGYDDYSMINTYKFVTSEFIEEDGGQLLFKTKETSYYEDLNSFCKDTLEMVDQLFDPATLEILQITQEVGMKKIAVAVITAIMITVFALLCSIGSYRHFINEMFVQVSTM